MLSYQYVISFGKFHKEVSAMVKKVLSDDAALEDGRPYAEIIDDFAKLLAASVTSMNGNFFDLIAQYDGKHKCSAEEFQYVERVWSVTAKALEYTIDTAQYIGCLFEPEATVLASAKLCEECMSETNRLLASGWGTAIIGSAEFGADLTKLLAKAAEIYAASISKNVRTLVDRVSSIKAPSRKQCKISKEAFYKLEDLCKYQADVSYSAAEISAYFKNVVRSLKNKKQP